jgi:hypothetical protein
VGPIVRFRLQITPVALDIRHFRSPMVTSAGCMGTAPTLELWRMMRRPGAQVWALHQTDDGPQGRRILMASQRYGAGLPRLLRSRIFAGAWRRMRTPRTTAFGGSYRLMGRQDVSIHLAEQELRLIRTSGSCGKAAQSKNIIDNNRNFFVRAEYGQKQLLREEALELEAMRRSNSAFTRLIPVSAHHRA